MPNKQNGLFWVYVIGFVVLGLVTPRFTSAQSTASAIVWPVPAPIRFPAPLSDVQLNARALRAAPAPVDLTSSFNITGITTDGFPFAGGFDGSGWAFAEETLSGPILFQGVPFRLGPANQPDSVSSAVVLLPAGSFGSLEILGDLVNNEVPADARFTITYTDGSTTTLDQQMSDWINPRNYAGESLVKCVASRHILDGSTDHNSACLYGYSLPLDPARVAFSLTLPKDRNVVLLAATLVPPEVPGSFAYTPANGEVPPSGMSNLMAVFTPADPQFSTNSLIVPLQVQPPAPAPWPTSLLWPSPASLTYPAPLSAAQLDATASFAVAPVSVPLDGKYRVNAIYDEDSLFLEKGFDGSSRAFSANLLGPSLSYAGYQFALGPLAVPDAVTSATIALPTGRYSTLYLLGAGANGTQVDQPFTINYTDGSSAVTNVSLSSWDNPQGLAGESTVVSMPYCVTPDGGTLAGHFAVYGYQISLDSSRTVETLTLPPTTNVVLLAVGLGSGALQPASGTYVYTPPIGTVLPRGTSPLGVVFTPDDGADLAGATGANSLVVTFPVLTVQADDVARLFGTANPTFTGIVQGALPGDVFRESFSTLAGPSSPAGSYPILPAITGSGLAGYREVVDPGTLTVARAPVIATLTASAQQALQGQAVAIYVVVTSTTSGTPMGTVAVSTEAGPLGSATLNAGSATLHSILPVGTHQLQMTYMGDADFEPATVIGPLVSVVPLDFTLQTPQGSTLTAAPGQSATLTLHLAPTHGVYAAPVTFTLAGTLFPFATATFSPASVPAAAGPANVVLRIDTPRLAENRQSSAPLALALLLPMGAWCLRGRRRSLRWSSSGLFVLLLCLGLLAAAQGCGSGYHDTEYPLTVTASDGTTQHSVAVTLHTLAGPQ